MNFNTTYDAVESAILVNALEKYMDQVKDSSPGNYEIASRLSDRIINDVVNVLTHKND